MSSNKPMRAVVIGSGFGGSVSASRLVDAGIDVTLLERGPWRDSIPVKHAGIEERKPLPRNGGLLSVLRSINLPFGPRERLNIEQERLPGYFCYTQSKGDMHLECGWRQPHLGGGDGRFTHGVLGSACGGPV